MQNGRYLFGGECHANCAQFPGYEEAGSGRFNRRCEPVNSTFPDLLPAALVSQFQVAPATPTSDFVCQTLRECAPVREAAQVVSGLELALACTAGQ